jgi:cytochrome c
MYRSSLGVIPFGVALSTGFFAATPPAQATEALARQKNCLNCHAVDRKLVGPAFKDVARRYAGQKDAVPKLAEKVVKGGAGAWGPVAMAANPQVSPEEAQRLVEWVLGLK